VQREKTSRLPEESTWLSSSSLQEVDVGRQPPLGLRRSVEPELAHIELAAGDTILLASTTLGSLATEAQIAATALRPNALDCRDSLEALAGGEDFSAIIIKLSVTGDAGLLEEPGQPPSGLSWISQRFTEAAQAVRGWFTARRTEETPQVAEEDADDDLEWEEPGPTAPSVDLRDVAARARDALSTVGRSLARLLSMMLPESDAAEGGARPSDRQRSGGRAARRAAAEREERAAINWMRLALLIPVVVALVYAVTRVQHDRARAAEYQRLMTAVDEATAAFEASTAADEQRAELTEALALLAQAAEIRPDDQEIGTRRQNLQDSLDRLNRVHKITQLDELFVFSAGEGAEVQPRDVLVYGTEVYVLDQGTQQVHHLMLNATRDGLKAEGGSATLLQRGDEFDGLVVGEILGIAWVDAGGFLGVNTLLTVDRDGHIFRSDPGFEPTVQPAADSSTWERPLAATGYYGRLYLLDPEAGRILRYTLTNEGLESAPDDYLATETAADLTDAVDLAIDGNVYVLHKDGAITKYQDGVAVPYSPRNLDRPLADPSAILVTGFMDEDGYVYIADTGNHRVVQLSKTGDFVRQLQVAEPAELDQLRDIYVDESSKELFLINGDRLYVATLPG
jgi:hypothetical protein